MLGCSSSQHSVDEPLEQPNNEWLTEASAEARTKSKKSRRVGLACTLLMGCAIVYSQLGPSWVTPAAAGGYSFYLVGLFLHQKTKIGQLEVVVIVELQR